MKARVLLSTFLVCSFAAAANAQNKLVSRTEKETRELPMVLVGSFWVDTPIGSVDVLGIDGDKATVTATKTVYASDKSALDAAFDQCLISWEGDERVRFARMLQKSIVPNSRCTVSYDVNVPRTVDVKVGARAGDIRVRNVIGGVTVKSVNSNVLLSGVSGATAIDIVNGHIVLDFPRAPVANVQATVINGDIDIFVPGDSSLGWSAGTVAGDVLTSMPVRGTIVDGIFHGHFNAPGGPSFTTQSVLGRVFLLARGTNRTQSRSVRNINVEQVPQPAPNTAVTMAPTQKIQTPIVGGPFTFMNSDQVVDVSIGEVRGPARVTTAAGAIDLGVVFGDCTVLTAGGPLSLGEIMGSLQARTGAGDVLVRAARGGGEVHTDGGIIRVFYTGGPMTLGSGGGDIVVRQAAGSINASTPSGDITITVDPNLKTDKVEAKTGKGNVLLNVSPSFAADVDATVVTSNPDQNAIHTDFNTLTIRREQVAGGRTRIHATGKINGGGDRVELHAEDGDVTISSQAGPPVSIVKP